MYIGLSIWTRSKPFKIACIHGSTKLLSLHICMRCLLFPPAWEVGMFPPAWEVGMFPPAWEVGMFPPAWEVGMFPPAWEVGIFPPAWEVYIYIYNLCYYVCTIYAPHSPHYLFRHMKSESLSIVPDPDIVIISKPRPLEKQMQQGHFINLQAPSWQWRMATDIQQTAPVALHICPMYTRCMPLAYTYDVCHGWWISSPPTTTTNE